MNLFWYRREKIYMSKELTKKIDDLFNRSTEEVIDPNDYFKNKLIAYASGESDEQPIVKLGADPNRPDIHLGHAVALRKLRTMQDLGAKVVFLIGDFTALIGDPTGKSKVRPEIQASEIEANMQTYLEQIGKILKTDDDSKFVWIKNSDWYLDLADLVAPSQTLEGKSDKPGVPQIKINFPENSYFAKAIQYEKTRMQKQYGNHLHQVTMKMFLQTLRGITYSQLIQRDMFQDRLQNEGELYMHEMMYPVLQGLDSLMIARIFGSCDLEIGGTDQLFNNLMGRTIMKNAGLSPQSVMAFSLLEGLDGNEKMSKSLDNYVGVSDDPTDMYGKIMSLPDHLIGRWFELTTFTPVSEVEQIKTGLKSGKANPYELKRRLAREIVAIYHGEDSAQLASDQFEKVFSNNEIPDDLESVSLLDSETFGEALVRLGVVNSKGQWRRLVEQNAVTNMGNDEKIIDEKFIPQSGEVFRIGKKRFVKIS